MEPHESNLLDNVNPHKTDFKDNMHNAIIGYSFFLDPSNESLTAESNVYRVFDCIYSDDALSERFFSGDGVTPSHQAMAAYLKHAGDFVKLLALLILITCGTYTTINSIHHSG